MIDSDLALTSTDLMVIPQLYAMNELKIEIDNEKAWLTVSLA